MCRLLLLIDKKFDENIIKKFINQSITKKNTPGIKYNYDKNYHKEGYGFAWRENNKWKLYKNEKCFKEDDNFKNIIKDITKKTNNDNNVLIGHIRSNKNLPFKKNYYNTHPFKYKENIWCHNGIIDNFLEFKKNHIKNIKSDYIKNINGTTDSEFMFYLFLSQLNNNSLHDLNICIINFFKILEKYNKKISANIIYSNNNYTLITRYINSNNECPSLYYSLNESILISSEPLTKNFEIIKNHTGVIIDNNNKLILNKFKFNNN